MAFHRTFPTFAPLRLVYIVQFITVHCSVHCSSLLFVTAFYHRFLSRLIITAFRHCSVQWLVLQVLHGSLKCLLVCCLFHIVWQLIPRLPPCPRQHFLRLQVPYRTAPPLNFKRGIFGVFFLFVYDIQHCFFCCPSDSTVSEDAEIEPRTVATTALALTTRLDLIHTRLDLIPLCKISSTLG